MQTPQKRTTARLKNPRKHTQSSQKWLLRQLNDPYVLAAKQEGYRSRAAYKLKEIQEKFSFLKRGDRVVELGCAPGGWSQVVMDVVSADPSKRGFLVGVDLVPVDPVEGAVLLQGDFLDPACQDIISEHLGGQAHSVLSDMAASSTGHSQTDHLRIMGLLEEALAYAETILRPGGHFVAKVLQGGAEKELLLRLKKHFQKVVHFKPKSSRKDSAEMYVVALSFRSGGDVSS